MLISLVAIIIIAAMVFKRLPNVVSEPDVFSTAAKPAQPSPSPAPARPSRPPDDFLTAVEHYNAKKLNEAEEVLLKLTLEKPDFRAYSLLGTVYLEKDQAVKAVDPLSSSLKLKPSASVYSNLGLAYYKLANYPDAIDAYKKAIQLDSKNLHRFYNLAICYQKEKDYPNAIIVLQQALRNQPNNPVTLRYLAVVSQANGDILQARKFYERILEVDPGNSDAKKELSRL